MTKQQHPDADLNFTGELIPCGAVLPPFHAGPICESYSATFTTWEGVPPVPVTGSWDCLDPGCTASMGQSTALIGIDMDDHEGAWPQPDTLGALSCPGGTQADRGGTAMRIDSRAIDCKMDNGAACDIAASAFTDESLPVYHPLNVGDVPPDRVGDAFTGYPIHNTSVSAGPVFKSARLGDLGGGFTCADAFAAVNGL